MSLTKTNLLIITTLFAYQTASCVLHSVIGWNSKIGKWTRVEGSPASDHNIDMMKNGVKSQSITILGK